MERPNEWRQINANEWMCTLYDVWHQYGVWYASFYVGPIFEQTFRTAEAAMRHCNVRSE